MHLIEKNKLFILFIASCCMLISCEIKQNKYLDIYTSGKHLKNRIRLNDSIYIDKFNNNDSISCLAKYNNNGDLLEIINKVNGHFFGDRLYFKNNRLKGYDFMKNDSASCSYFEFNDSNKLVNEYNTPLVYLDLGLNQTKDSFEMDMYFCKVIFKQINFSCKRVSNNFERCKLQTSNNPKLINNLYCRYVFLLPLKDINGIDPIVNVVCKTDCETIYGEKRNYNDTFSIKLWNKYLKYYKK